MLLTSCTLSYEYNFGREEEQAEKEPNGNRR